MCSQSHLDGLTQYIPQRLKPVWPEHEMCCHRFTHRGWGEHGVHSTLRGSGMAPSAALPAQAASVLRGIVSRMDEPGRPRTQPAGSRRSALRLVLRPVDQIVSRTPSRSRWKWFTPHDSSLGAFPAPGADLPVLPGLGRTLAWFQAAGFAWHKNALHSRHGKFVLTPRRRSAVLDLGNRRWLASLRRLDTGLGRYRSGVRRSLRTGESPTAGSGRDGAPPLCVEGGGRPERLRRSAADPCRRMYAGGRGD